MRGIGAAVGVAALVALAACGGGTPPVAAPTPAPTVTPPSSNGGPTPPPSFNASAVRIAEVPVPTESPATDGPVYPSVIDVGLDGSVYFGQLNADLATFGNFGIFRYAGGTFTQTLPFPASNYNEGGVDAIDAHDSPTVMWSSSYMQYGAPFSYGDYMQCGASGGVASQCPFSSLSGFVQTIVTANDGTIWTAGSACCGQGAAGYPAQVPPGTASGSYDLDIANGPNSTVWGVLQHNGPVYEFASDGSVMNTFQLPPGSSVSGSHSLIEGADGAMWLADGGNNAIARITASGQVTEYPIPTPNSGVQSIALAADGGMWFTENTADKIGRIDTTGKIYEFNVPSANAGPTAIAAAPSACTCNPAQLWFTETTANQIASIAY